MGYETPVAMPSMGVYNTDLMKMYIAGVKDQYEKGREEMKDFMKLYGDFYSPIVGDTETYNNMTIGGARDMINQMMAAGIDPYKSPEARAAISRYIASVPTGTLNAIKQNAENKKLYDRAVAEATAKGIYNPEMEQMELERLGLNDFKTVDPNGNVRTWDRLAPIQGKTLYELALPQFQKYGKTEDLGPGSRPFYRKKGVSEDSKNAATEATVREMDATPYGKFFRKRAEDEVMRRAQAEGMNLTPDQVSKLTDVQYRKNILDEMNSYLQPTEELDQAGLTMWKQQQENIQHALNRAAANKRAELAAAAKNTPKNPTDERTPLSQQIIRSSNTRAAQTENEAILTAADKWLTDFANKAVQWRSKHIEKGGISVAGAQKWWQNALNDPQKYGLKDGNGNWTNTAKTWFTRTGVDPQKFDKILAGEDSSIMDQYNLSKTFAGKKSNEIGPNQLRIAADKSYNRYINYKVESKQLRNYLNDVFTQSSGQVTPTGEFEKAIVFNSNSGVHYTPVRRIRITGGGLLLKKIQKDFDRYLQTSGIKLYKRDTQIGVAGIPKSSGSSSIDIFGKAEMSKKDFDAFLKQYGYDEKTAMESLGLSITRVTNNKTEAVSAKKNTYKPLGKLDYVQVPLTRTVLNSPSPSYENTPFDEEWEKIIAGTSGVTKMANTIEENSLGEVDLSLLGLDENQ